MGYNDLTEFPRGSYRVTFNTGNNAIAFAAGTTVRIAGVTVYTTGQVSNFVFTNAGETETYMIIRGAIGSVAYYPVNFLLTDGLHITSSQTSSSNQKICLHYFAPSPEVTDTSGTA